jgi:putative oxidoreductase
MPTDLMSTLIVIARLLLGGAFVAFGLRNIGNLPRLTEAMAARGLPQPRLAMIAGIALQIAGGVLTAIGPWGAVGAAGLIVFVLVAAALFHNFWDYAGPERGPHVNAWIMNIGLVGAFLLVIATAL